jgi:hypothetical protein
MFCAVVPLAFMAQRDCPFNFVPSAFGEAVEVQHSAEQSSATVPMAEAVVTAAADPRTAQTAAAESVHHMAEKVPRV